MKLVATCIRLKQFEGDIKRLKKRHRSVKQDVIYIERLLEIGQTLPQTIPYSGCGNRNLFKTRVVDTSSGKGKSSGYRLIYEKGEVEENDLDVIVLILLYDKNMFDNETKVRNEVKARLKSTDYPKLP